MKRTTSLCLVTLLFVLSGASTGLAATVTETFDSYTNGTALTAIGGGGVWTIGTAYTVVDGGGVAGSKGLSSSSTDFQLEGPAFPVEHAGHWHEGGHVPGLPVECDR